MSLRCAGSRSDRPGRARLTSIEWTAYPQFKRLTSARALHVFFTPTADEVDWAQERVTEPQALPAVVVALKCFQKMARFSSWQEVPEVVVDHARRCLGLGEEVGPDLGPGRTAKRHRNQITAPQSDPGPARTAHWLGSMSRRYLSGVC
ncbi:DUF4158 domain-containing protein [Planomonospora sp. ID91781]|uniref:DUF4158 domain-containing protein n=1 Tax=Planomonospora sp. ID91781 TaxID=2738135 RepID=UPI001E5CF1B6|nr:DUF4158 domain-containing protein [Planomonospora sp. ID91781]